MENELNHKGNNAFEQGDFRQAIHFWSLALEDKQAHPAVILANRIALRIKPNATQLHQLLRQAEENLRAGFLSERHHEVSSAAQQAFSAAAEQVQHGHWQQALQQQSSQDSGHASFPISSDNKTVSAEDNACDVLNIKSGLPLADIRDAYVSAMKKTHPDKGGSADEFCKVQSAFNYLTQVAAKPHH
ncbi:MAG: hypothetical protein FRX49_03887 [Trebouxia sp. A1-2]|nr:MAG: hypothetical protein FRX49_03887 [Trebouxia sp. A1-2]